GGGTIGAAGGGGGGGGLATGAATRLGTWGAAGGGGGADTEAGAGAESGRRTAISPPHTEQRARTPRSGTLAGSTRNTVAHCGQVTFIGSLTGFAHRGHWGRCGSRDRRAGGRPRTPNPAATWRNSSSRWPARSLQQGARSAGAGW